MRTIARGARSIVAAIVIVLFNLPADAVAQDRGDDARKQEFSPVPSPSDRAVGFSAREVQTILGRMDATNAKFWRVVEGPDGAYNLNVRMATEDTPRVETTVHKVWVSTARCAMVDSPVASTAPTASRVTRCAAWVRPS